MVEIILNTGSIVVLSTYNLDCVTYFRANGQVHSMLIYSAFCASTVKFELVYQLKVLRKLFYIYASESTMWFNAWKITIQFKLFVSTAELGLFLTL